VSVVHLPPQPDPDELSRARERRRARQRKKVEHWHRQAAKELQRIGADDACLRGLDNYVVTLKAHMRLL
jgi:hypothetical protein